ncbi:unnamed protein product [Medioppia subpectinata]|uniref:Uncharacterized protein n=1 Tax=Medioppia subpectinata TaxID=1979941 RepID=A0A7R9Q3Z9_9ACAR|nr:unnamed protein product [Medioppia subpectinata]CAG2110938.1 unnamed protein product [Medioppia subpectinata]
MSRLVVTLLAIALTAVITVSGGGHGGGRGGGGKGGMGMMRLDKESKAKLCSADNMVDAKMTQYREEVAKCYVDPCAADASDVTGKLTVLENKLMAAMHCSDKYQECQKKQWEAMRKAHGKGKGGGGDEGADEGEKAEANEAGKAKQEERMKKIKAYKECVKAAFTKVFG